MTMTTTPIPRTESALARIEAKLVRAEAEYEALREERNACVTDLYLDERWSQMEIVAVLNRARTVAGAPPVTVDAVQKLISRYRIAHGLV